MINPLTSTVAIPIQL